MEDLLGAARAALARETGVAPQAIRGVLSPYRICPLGAHSDHQQGPVTGLAIGLGTALAFAPAPEPVVEVARDRYTERWRVDPGDPVGAREAPTWVRYLSGAVAVLRDVLPAKPPGLRLRVAGALPGAGLGSSASVVVAYLLALARASGVSLTDAELVARARRVENEHVGVACGILDPASVVGARRDRLLSIDTAAGRWEAVAPGPAAPQVRFLVAWTGLSRSLAGSGFNQRVSECREAAIRLGALSGHPASLLGELPDEVFEAHLADLPAVLGRRARHFHTERGRVRRGLACWQAGDLAGFGALMNASCESSLHDYETGSEELARLQEILRATPGVLGARFSGAGYGGCAMALVLADAAEAAARRVTRDFAAAFPDLAGRARSFVVRSEDGARIV